MKNIVNKYKNIIKIIKWISMIINKYSNYSKFKINIIRNIINNYK